GHLRFGTGHGVDPEAGPPEAHAGGVMSRIPFDVSQWAAALAAAPADPAARAGGVARVAEAGYDMHAVAAEVAKAYGEIPIRR
ncbi:MAG: hypothetical protein SPK07_09965, partial [Coriobacteriales bacterium]|nr:hypothetical protein [Coriobacteriales bacterium]